MKRLFTTLFTALLLTAALCVTASASDFDAVAEDLSAIGMFRGTDKGFELDRAPTRSEAAIMLVRLYGAEEAAQTAYEAGEISHPFTDVSEFTSPYVAWLYTNGITNGFTETTFASQRACTAQNYAAFLLRALGYKDGVDFQYADTLTFAQEKGFYDPTVFAGEFLRDDLAALTYQALAADMASSETYLLDSLIKSGAVDAKAAGPMTETIEAYRTMQEAMAEIDANAMDLDIDMNMDIAMSMGTDGIGALMSEATKTTGSMKIIADDPGDVQMAYTLKTTVADESMEIGMWMKDNWVYTSVDDGIMKMNVKYPVEDEMAVLNEVSTVDVTSMDVSSLAMIESITSTKSGSNTIYTMVISENMGGMMDSVSEITGEASPEMDISPITAIYTLDRNGALKSVSMVFKTGMNMDVPMDDGTVITMEMLYDYDVTMTVNATGSKVKITWPDFSDFVEIAPEQLSGATA